MNPIQQIAMLSSIAKFITQYVHTFTNNTRDQIIVLMGDEVLFLTEFLDKIKDIATSIVLGGDYNQAGHATIPKLNKKTHGLKSFVAELSRNKVKLQNKILTEGTKSTSIYPELFNNLQEEMKRITDKVLGKEYTIRLQFKFDKMNII